jgi:probable rRNA maturation factor
MSKVTLDYQTAEGIKAAPEESTIALAANAVIQHLGIDKPVELTVRVVKDSEAAELNHQFRSKNYPTNVLSFPFESPVELPIQLLGDLVICQSVVEREAKEQNKSVIAHWTHMVIHGTLHLLGYDHIQEEDAVEMESIEKRIMASLDYPDPYETTSNTEHTL